MKAPVIAMMLSLALSAPALAATFVYVSNAEDGDIGIYTLLPDGSLKAGPGVPAAKVVMPMAVSPDKRFLVAAVRSKPYEAYTYAIDRKTGELNKYVFVPHLGTDQIFQFVLDKKSGKLSSNTPATVQMKQRVGRVSPTAL